MLVNHFLDPVFEKMGFWDWEGLWNSLNVTTGLAEFIWFSSASPNQAVWVKAYQPPWSSKLLSDDKPYAEECTWIFEF